MCLCMRFTSHLDSKPRKVTAHKNLRCTLQTPNGTAMAPETFNFSVEKKSKIPTSRVISPNQPVLEGYVDVREATWG